VGFLYPLKGKDMRRATRPLCLITLLLMAACPGRCLYGKTPEAELLEKIQTAIREQLDSIKTLDATLAVENYFPRRPFQGPGRTAADDGTGKGAAAGWGQPHRMRIVIDGPKRMYTDAFPERMGYNVHDVELKTAFDGTSGYTFTTMKKAGHHGSGSIVAADPTKMYIENSWYGNPYGLLRAIDSGRAVIKGVDSGGLVFLEASDGPLTSLYYLDRKVGYQAVRRDNFREGAPLMLEETRYQKVEGGAWFPMSGTRTFFLVTPDQPELRATANIERMRVAELAVNKPLANHRFTIEFPKKIFLYDGRSNEWVDTPSGPVKPAPPPASPPSGGAGKAPGTS
jgi:hypothetical protein